MEFMEFLIEEALIMVPVLYIIGEFIKRLDTVKDKYIPITLLVVSVGFTPLVIGAYNADTIVQAILVAGVTVLSNQLIKQSRKVE